MQIFVVVVRMMFLPLYEIVVFTCEGFRSSNTLSCCCRLVFTETTVLSGLTRITKRVMLLLIRPVSVANITDGPA